MTITPPSHRKLRPRSLRILLQVLRGGPMLALLLGRGLADLKEALISSRSTGISGSIRYTTSFTGETLRVSSRTRPGANDDQRLCT